MPRPKTTGRFNTREELEERVLFLYKQDGLSLSQIATSCGVSYGVTSSIISAPTTKKASRKTKATAAGATRWVICFQDTPKKKAPFEAELVKELGNYCRIKIGKSILTVNRGACSTTPYTK